jgi:hypothetical protein
MSYMALGRVSLQETERRDGREGSDDPVGLVCQTRPHKGTAAEDCEAVA